MVAGRAGAGTDASAPVEESAPVRRGCEVFLESLAAHGVRYLFGNPGTTEMPLLDGLAESPDLEYILTLHESVAVGAAHYYAQASGATGVVNLHVAPGLGNALGMLYNAWEANTPLVLTAGQQDSRMRLRQPLLGHDLVAMAAPLVKWSAEARRADELPHLVHRAFKVANDTPPGPVFLSLPIDVMEETTSAPVLTPSPIFTQTPPDPQGVEGAARILAAARRPMIVVGDGVARAAAQPELVALAELLGAPVFSEGLMHQVNFPTSHTSSRDRIGGDHGAIRRTLSDADAVLLVGGSFFEEVWFESGSPFPSAAAVIQIDSAPGAIAHNFPVDLGLLANPRAALSALEAAIAERADPGFNDRAAARNRELAAAREQERVHQERRARAHWDESPIAPARLMAELERRLPADVVVVNEAITAGADLRRSLAFDRAGDYYGTRGGGIGQGLPGALGVKLAHPDRPVIALSGDGSAMYSVQALWTAAHHHLPVVFVILHNRTYRILKFNMDLYRQRFSRPGGGPYPYMDLTEPELDFVEMARGMGVEGRRVSEPGELAGAIETAMRSGVSGEPYLLDVMLEGRIPARPG